MSYNEDNKLTSDFAQLTTSSFKQRHQFLDYLTNGTIKGSTESKEHNIMKQVNEDIKLKISKNERKIIGLTSTSKAICSNIHKDLVRNIEYNYYGHRLATCSNDQSVKIWDQSDTGEWKCSAYWKAHNAAVFRVHWAHPKFGHILVTCSFDRTAIVWEETCKLTCSENNSIDLNWIKRHSFECRSAVNDIKFSTNTESLILAICTAKGLIELHEALDQMNLSDWTQLSIIECNVNCSCISWNSYFRTTIPMIAIGFEDCNVYSKVSVYANENKWIKLENMCSIVDLVHEISFAPNVGRSFEMLAVATNRNVKLISLKQCNKTENNSSDLFEVCLMTDLYAYSTPVWRLSWNIIGNILATFGNDEILRLWAIDDFDLWSNVAVINGDSAQVNYFKYAKQ